jgi:two-component system sensor histidine kinase TctE
LRRLSTHLLLWLLLPMLALSGLAVVVHGLRSEVETDEAYDRALLGSALVMAEHVTVRDGRVAADIPQSALKMLESRTQDHIFYNVSCVDPTFYIAGWQDLPPPPQLPKVGGEPVFVDMRYNGHDVRLVALRRLVFDASDCTTVAVRVAESTEARDAMAARMDADATTTLLALTAAAAVCVVFGVRRGLRPLLRLRDEIRARDENDLAPIDVGQVPAEVAPLLDAINLQLRRQRSINDAHRRFVADASHQLKTPLAVLKMQADLALAQADPARMRRHVQELHDGVESTTRVVHQLLTLLRSDPLSLHAQEAVDLAEVAREATFELLPLALAKGVDVAFDGAGAVAVVAHEVLLHELVANLVDNAIQFTPAGGHVAVLVGAGDGDGALLRVADDGPGIPDSERAKVFTRFYRAPGSSGDGCGLGLAIVRQIADRYGAVVTLDAAAGGGLSVTVRFAASG